MLERMSLSKQKSFSGRKIVATLDFIRLQPVLSRENREKFLFENVESSGAELEFMAVSAISLFYRLKCELLSWRSTLPRKKRKRLSGAGSARILISYRNSLLYFHVYYETYVHSCAIKQLGYLHTILFIALINRIRNFQCVDCDKY